MSRNLAAVRIHETGQQLAGTSNPQWLDRRGAGGSSTKGQNNKVRVTRYWPGKAPDWAPEEDEDEDEDEDPRRTRNESDDEEEEAAALAASRAASKGDVPEIQAKHDPRLARLAASRGIDREEAVAARRAVASAQILDDSEEEGSEDDVDATDAHKRGTQIARATANESDEEDEEEDEDMIELRRMQMKRRMMEKAKAKQQEEEMAMEDEEEDEEEEDSSEYETDSEEEGPGGRVMLKPVFVPKTERETIVEREKLKEELDKEEDRKKERLQSRKVETRQIVEAEIRRDAEAERADAGATRNSDVDTDDEENEAEEYELWKQRELRRIKRDRDLREAAFKEREELEMVRSMTEEERREWERKNPKTAKPSDLQKQKWNFLQKYYHKGAFFQEAPDDKFGTQGEEVIYGRDFGTAVGEDVMDKSILPKVMQVRRGQFGRSGRSKWTHLVNEDTTSWDTPWNMNDPLRTKYTSKMAGMGSSMEKPKVKDLLKKGTTI